MESKLPKTHKGTLSWFNAAVLCVLFSNGDRRSSSLGRRRMSARRGNSRFRQTLTEQHLQNDGRLIPSPAIRGHFLIDKSRDSA